jgi:hypothetical protein
MHLDGKGDGQLFARYMREVANAHSQPGAKRQESSADFQKRTLDILLDGRSSDELMKQIRSAYTRLGVRL